MATTLTRGSVSVELDFPYNPQDEPSRGQLLKRTPTGKIYAATITGGTALDEARLTRTYRLNTTQKAALNTFLNNTCAEWTLPFTLDDPLAGMLSDVFADRRAFRGFRPAFHHFYLATITYQIST